jgi:arylsulfatase A
METEPELTRLRTDETTMADLFAARSFATGLVGKWHLGLGPESHPRQRGFQEFAGFVGAHQVPSYSSYELEIGGVARKFEGPYLTDELSRHAIEFVRRHRDRPFFLHLAHYAPHRPLGAPREVVAAYEQRGVPSKIATVYAMIEIMDRGIGELLKTLQTLGLREKTLVIFASDNGPDPLVGERFNLQRRGTKYQVFEGGIRVPFLVSWPGTLRPRSSDAFVHFIDVVPTLMELCGLERASKLPLDGTSFADVLFERRTTDRQRPYFWQWNRGIPNFTHNAAMRDAEWKLVRPPVTHGVIAGDSVLPLALFNLETDPTETTDVAAQHPARVEQMRSALEKWTRTVEQDRTATRSR